MTERKHPGLGVLLEAAMALILGGVVAWLVSPAAFRRIDDLVVVFVSIVVAAAVPGVALTAAAPRPRVATQQEAMLVGQQLSDQVRFWFGFLGWGALAAVTVIFGKAMDWTLITPRAATTPTWVPPEGGRWLELLAAAFVIFLALRTRRVVRAVHDLIALGTRVHVDDTAARRSLEARVIEEQVAAMPLVPSRGDPLGDRSRH